MNTTMNFSGINEIKSFAASQGSYFFSRQSMRFFNSRIGAKVYRGCYFITSEQFDHKSPRLFSARFIRPNGSIETIGEFQQFKTAREAAKFINSMPEGLPQAYHEMCEMLNGNQYEQIADFAKQRGGAYVYALENWDILRFSWMEKLSDQLHAIK